MLRWLAELTWWCRIGVIGKPFKWKGAAVTTAGECLVTCRWVAEMMSDWRGLVGLFFETGQQWRLDSGSWLCSGGLSNRKW